MSLIATWFSEGRWAQHPPDPRYPLGMLFDASAGRPFAPQTRTEHEAKAAAAAAKARAALTPRSTSGGQTYYDELRQKDRPSVPAPA